MQDGGPNVDEIFTINTGLKNHAMNPTKCLVVYRDEIGIFNHDADTFDWKVCFHIMFYLHWLYIRCFINIPYLKIIIFHNLYNDYFVF